MNDKVGFWDSDHGFSLHIQENYFDQPGGQVVPAKTLDLSPFSQRIVFGAGTVFCGVGLVEVGLLLATATGRDFFGEVVLP